MQFQPGHSGNPAGRPPGARNRKTLEVEALLMDRAEEVVTSIIDRAKDGHPTAMRLFLTRAFPTGRDRQVAIPLPAIKQPEDAHAAMAVVTEHLTAGHLTISEAMGLINLIERMLRLAQRIHTMTGGEEAAFEAAAQPAVEDAPAAPPAPEAPERAAPASPHADGTNGKPAETLYFPVNDESSHQDAGSVESEPGADGRSPGNTAPPLYFPVNEAA
jgi:hypothetical protein